MNDVLALVRLNGCAPETIVAIGVQPVELSDFGGSLCDDVRARLPEAVALALRELAAWGFPAIERRPEHPYAPLHSASLALAAYETGRPSAEEACRSGDARLLERGGGY